MSDNENEIETIVVCLDSPAGHYEVGMHMLRKALQDPEKRALIDKACADKRLGPRELFTVAFTFGVSSALCEVVEGHLVVTGVPNPESH